MYKCGSCGSLLKKTGDDLEYCPKCGHDGLTEELFLCPECHENLGEPIDVDLHRIGWHCSKCKVKVYKEID